MKSLIRVETELIFWKINEVVRVNIIKWALCKKGIIAENMEYLENCSMWGKIERIFFSLLSAIIHFKNELDQRIFSIKHYKHSSLIILEFVNSKVLRNCKESTPCKVLFLVVRC